MHLRHAMRAVVAGAALAAAALTANAADVADHEAARVALRDRQYTQVVQITGEIARSEPNSALNWYRMAIAAFRTGNVQLAADALSRAERADPSLGFASSPQRVAKLRSDIQQLQPAAAPGIGMAAGTAAADEEIDPGATTAIAAVGQQLTKLQDTMERQLKALDSKVGTVATRQEAAVRASNFERAAWVVGFLLVVLGAAFGIALIFERAARARRQSDLRNISKLPLQDVICVTRDIHALLMQRLQLHGHENSDLFVQMSRLVPALERESGRSRVSLSDLTRGEPLSDVAHPMQARAKVIGKSDPSEVHQAALSRALSTAGLTRPSEPKRLVA